MRNRKIIIYIMVIIILFSNLLIASVSGKNSIYQKKVTFNNPSDVIDDLSDINLKDIDNKDSDDFKECLSKRKRAVGSDVHSFDRLSVKSVDYTSEKAKSILETYKKMRQEFYKSSSDINAVAAVINMDLYRDNRISSTKSYNVVFIDEGEGYVIDFFVESDVYDKNNKNY